MNSNVSSYIANSSEWLMSDLVENAIRSDVDCLLIEDLIGPTTFKAILRALENGIQIIATCPIPDFHQLIRHISSIFSDDTDACHDFLAAFGYAILTVAPENSTPHIYRICKFINP